MLKVLCKIVFQEELLIRALYGVHKNEGVAKTVGRMIIIAQRISLLQPYFIHHKTQRPIKVCNRASGVRRRRLTSWPIPQPIWYIRGNITRDRINCPNSVRFHPGIKLMQQLLEDPWRPCRQLLHQTNILKFFEIQWCKTNYYVQLY
jgi:hypothetical protein